MHLAAGLAKIVCFLPLFLILMKTRASELCAAVDLGSNSFHLLVGRWVDEEFVTVERLKNKVQLLAGFRDGQILPDAMQRGYECLESFAQRLSEVASDQVRVMGTSALRQADNRDEFVARAEQILGVPVQVISGEEEARLIDLGVADHLESPAIEGVTRSRLVIDIGGGSTELAMSSNASRSRRLERTISLTVGCVSLTDRFFSPAELVPSTYATAREAVLEVLDGLELSDLSADQVVGTSGSIESIQGVLGVNGWSDQCVDVSGLRQVEEAIADRRWITDVGLPGLAPERVDIFPAGVAILSALFERLQVERLKFVPASLLQGMLHRPREPGQSVQAHAVASLSRRFGVDRLQADRVAAQVSQLLGSAQGWTIDTDTRRLLGWAAQLHEVGQAISASHYQRHGGYLLENAPLRGFSPAERDDLVLLVRGHRRSFPVLAYRSVTEARREMLLRALVLLRLAVILERGHHDQRSPLGAIFTAEGAQLRLSLPAGWLDDNLLSARELEVEARQLMNVQLQLTVESLSE